ncbi:MAG: redoxin domain-containing protein [Candidatus Hydrogenedentota bacterium]
MNANDASARFKEAENFFDAKRFNEALTILDELDARFPKTRNLVYARAQCLIALGRFGDADALCHQLRDEFSDPRATGLLAKCATANRESPSPVQTNQVKRDKPSKGTRKKVVLAFVLIAIVGTGSYFGLDFGKSPSENLPSMGDATLIGSKLPDFTFKDIRYLPRTLADFGEKKAYVMMFFANDCPVAERYFPRFQSLDLEYQDRGVQFIAINVGAEDTIGDAAKTGIEFGLSIPIVKDMKGQVVEAVGATRSAEVAVIDAEGVLRYRGRIDDQYRLGGVKPEASTHELKDALDAVLSGNNVATPMTPVDGCIISPPTNAPADKKYTYAADVAPILNVQCIECHRPYGDAPFDLLSYQNAANFANMIAEVVEEERMPPWYAHPDHGEFRNERRLSREEKDILIGWARGGRAKGDLSMIAPLPTFTDKKWAEGEPDLVLTAEKEERLPTEGYIPYRYVTLPYTFPHDTYIQTLQIRSTNPTVAHHANLVYTTPSSGLNFAFLGGKVPGSPDGILQPGEAMFIPKDATLTLQIHYVTTGKEETDRMSVGFDYADGRVNRLVESMFIENGGFEIPAGHHSYEVHAEATLAEDVMGRALFSHMHLRGKDMSFVARYPDGTVENMLTVPNYSFDWQQVYEWEPGTKLFPKGTKFETSAHFDNSIFNPYNPDPSVPVRYGLQTHHEMMIGVFYYSKDIADQNLIVNPADGSATHMQTR